VAPGPHGAIRMTDNDAERKHCEEAIFACGGYYVDPNGGADTVDAEDAIECLIRERAAALAAGLDRRAAKVACVTLASHRRVQKQLRELHRRHEALFAAADRVDQAWYEGTDNSTRIAIESMRRTMDAEKREPSE